MTLVMSLEMTIDNVYDDDDNNGKDNVKNIDSRSREVGEFRHVLLPMFANCPLAKDVKYIVQSVHLLQCNVRWRMQLFWCKKASNICKVVLTAHIHVFWELQLRCLFDCCLSLLVASVLCIA